MRTKQRKETDVTTIAVISKLIILSIVFGLILTFLSMYVPIRVETLDQLSDLRFGKPVYFVSQYYGKTINENWLPWYTTPKFTAENYTTEFLLGNFLISLALNIIIATVIVVCIHFLRIYLRKRKKSN